jgi:hypothetical protein
VAQQTPKVAQVCPKVAQHSPNQAGLSKQNSPDKPFHKPRPAFPPLNIYENPLINLQFKKIMK